MDTITNRNGQLTSAVGPKAVDAFRLRTIIVMLKSEQKGLRFRAGSALKAAKAETGLRTNDRNQHIAALEAKLDQRLSEVAIVNE